MPFGPALPAARPSLDGATQPPPEIPDRPLQQIVAGDLGKLHPGLLCARPPTQLLHKTIQCLTHATGHSTHVLAQSMSTPSLQPQLWHAAALPDVVAAPTAVAAAAAAAVAAPAAVASAPVAAAAAPTAVAAALAADAAALAAALAAVAAALASLAGFPAAVAAVSSPVQISHSPLAVIRVQGNSSWQTTKHLHTTHRQAILMQTSRTSQAVGGGDKKKCLGHA